MKNKPVPNDFDSIQTNHMTIRRVKIINYLGLVIDENLYWNAHADLFVPHWWNTLVYLIKSIVYHFTYC